MSKEHFKKVLADLKIADNDIGEYRQRSLDIYEEHIGWLIEQAEKISEI